MKLSGVSITLEYKKKQLILVLVVVLVLESKRL